MLRGCGKAGGRREEADRCLEGLGAAAAFQPVGLNRPGGQEKGWRKVVQETGFDALRVMGQLWRYSPGRSEAAPIARLGPSTDVGAQQEDMAHLAPCGGEKVDETLLLSDSPNLVTSEARPARFWVCVCECLL